MFSFRVLFITRRKRNRSVFDPDSNSVSSLLPRWPSSSFCCHPGEPIAMVTAAIAVFEVTTNLPEGQRQEEGNSRGAFFLLPAARLSLILRCLHRLSPLTCGSLLVQTPRGGRKSPLGDRSSGMATRLFGGVCLPGWPRPTGVSP